MTLCTSHNEMQSTIVHMFKEGYDIRTLAKRHGVSKETVERLIRLHMIDRTTKRKR